MKYLRNDWNNEKQEYTIFATRCSISLKPQQSYVLEIQVNGQRIGGIKNGGFIREQTFRPGHTIFLCSLELIRRCGT